MSGSATWRKSSYSDGNNGNCVELRRDLAALRDSKAPAGPVLPGDVVALVAWARRA